MGDVFLFIMEKTNENVKKRRNIEREDKGGIVITLPYSKTLSIKNKNEKNKRSLTLYPKKKKKRKEEKTHSGVVRIE